jgi:gas vesicle protein
MDSVKRSDRKGLYFLLGIAAGAAAGWYLNSDRGRKVRHESAQAIGEWSEKAAENAQHIVEKSKNYAEDLAHKFQAKAKSTEEMAEDIINHN